MRNMNQATDIYISRCDGAPCGDAKLNLYKGADSTYNQELRKDILVFFKGTKSEKQKIMTQSKSTWTFLQKIWQVRNRHAVSNLPSQYVFFLKCCMAMDCPHPSCKQGSDAPRWFPAGPTLEYFPLPIPDPLPMGQYRK